jgi:L,D-transpeptidase YcbB
VFRKKGHRIAWPFFVAASAEFDNLSRDTIYRMYRDAQTRFSLANVLLLFFVATHGAWAADGDNVTLRSAIEAMRSAASVKLGKATLTNTATIAAFYQRNGMTPVWSRPGAIDELRRAILEAEGDGLHPADYHLAALDAAIASKDIVSADLIATDAVIRLLAHLRYGKVNPAQLNRAWNHPARLDGATLDVLLDAARVAPSLEQAIDQQRAKHFVYQGLREGLARYRGLAAAGGWPSVVATTRIKPGADDAGVPSMRSRLRVTGEWRGSDAELASTIYDDALVAAVKRFQFQHRLNEDGIIGKTTVDAMNVGADARVEQIRINLERARWTLGGLGQTFLLVNLPAYKAYLIRNGALEWDTRVQIGKAARKTPAFRTHINFIAFNPTWTVPPTILNEDIAPTLKTDPSYLEKRGLVAVERSSGRVVNAAEIDWSTASLSDYRLTQPAGHDNALGSVKFIMNNPYAIFLHDTPRRDLFAADQRLFSSGCIRVEHPLDLALSLLDPAVWTRERMAEVIRAGKTRTIPIDPPMPVAIVYWTASISKSGALRFARDAYDYDREVRVALDAPIKRAVWWPTSR